MLSLSLQCKHLLFPEATLHLQVRPILHLLIHTLLTPGPPPAHSIFFIISALTEFGLGRHRKKEQRFGPSPANNYTSGYGGRGGRFGSLFQRRNRADTATADPNALPSHPEPGHLRSSYDDTLTGGASTNGYSNKYGESGYGAVPATSVAGSTQPPHRYGDGTYNV